MDYQHDNVMSETTIPAEQPTGAPCPPASKVVLEEADDIDLVEQPPSVLAFL